MYLYMTSRSISRVAGSFVCDSFFYKSWRMDKSTIHLLPNTTEIKILIRILKNALMNSRQQKSPHDHRSKIRSNHKWTSLYMSEKEFQKEFSFKLIERQIKIIFIQHKGAKRKTFAFIAKRTESFNTGAKVMRSRREKKLCRRVSYMHISLKVSRAT